MPAAEPAGDAGASAAPVCLLSLSRDARIVAAGGAWTETTRWTPEAVAGRRLHEVLAPGTRIFLDTHCLPVLHAGGTIEEAAVEVVRPDGDRVPMLLYARAAPGGERFDLALVTAYDRRAYQDELAQMRVRERRANDLQSLITRLSGLALAGGDLRELDGIAVASLRDLLPADVVALVDRRAAGVALAIASAGGLEDEPPRAAVDAEVARAVARLRDSAAHVEVGPAAGLGALCGDGDGDVASLRVLVGPAERPEAILAVHRRGDERFTAFEITAVQAVAAILWTAITRFRDVQAVLHEALHDPLTRLPNRRSLLDRLTRCLAEDATPPAVLFVDLDAFKAVNDTYGHAAGDALLTAIAGRLRSFVRDRDTVARFGGDEFVVLCPEIGSGETVRRLVRRLGSALAEPFDVGGASLRVSASVGAVLAGPGDGPDDVLRAADAEMYRDKSRSSA